MRKYLVLWKDNGSKESRVDEVIEIEFPEYVKINYDDKGFIRLHKSRIINLMQFIDRKDINEKELHEGAIIKADIESYGIETFNDTKGLTGFIEYNKDLSLYHMVLPDCHIPIGDLENIEKIGVMPIDANLLEF